VAEPPLRQTQEPSLVRAVEQHLRDRETDQLRIRDPRPPAKTSSARQEIIDEHVNVRQQGVEVGGHNGLLGRRCNSTADFGASPPVPTTSESIV